MKKLLSKLDKPLLVVTFIFFIFGLIMILSASSMESYMRYNYSPYHYFLRHAIFLVVGFILFCFIIIFPTKNYKKLDIFIIGVIILALIGLPFLGHNAKNAVSWYKIGPITIQPSEFAKIILILCTAVFLEKNYENLNTPKVLAKLAVFLAVPVGLIVAEPDLSTSICVMATLFIIIFVGGLSLKLIGIMILVLVPAFGGFIWYIQQDNLPQFLKTYQINRILGHIYGSEYGASSDQQDNSVMAIGSGQLSGKGINNSTVATVKDTNLISEQQTDFIFSAVGEELGFIGSVIIIAILCLIVLQCIRVARHAKDKKGMYIATGIGALVAFQTFINIGVATALLPNTGLPLPFISYGLSSLVSMSAGIGLVLNINLQKKKY